MLIMEQKIEKSSNPPPRTRKLKSNREEEECGVDKAQKLYAQVIKKNFEIIDQLLKKLNFLILSTECKNQGNDEIQIQLSTLTKRFNILETDLESIHNEHRRENLFLRSNMNGIRTQVIGMGTNIKLLFEEVSQSKIQYYLQRKSPQLIHRALEREDPTISLKIMGGEEEEQIKKERNLHDSGFKQQNISNLITAQPEENEKVFKSWQGKSSNRNSQTRGEKKKDSIQQLQQPSQHEVQPEFNQCIQLLRKSQQQQPLPKAITNKIQVKRKQKPHKTDILNTIGRHEPQIRNIFMAAMEYRDEESIQQKFISIMKTIVSQSNEVSDDSRIRSYEVIPQQINRIFYNCMIDHKAGILINQMREDRKLQEKLSKIQICNERITQQNMKLLQVQSKIADLMCAQQIIKEKSKAIEKQIQKMKMENKNYVTSQQIFEETFKLTEKSRKLWEQSYSNFANKNQTKKALLNIENKISQINYHIVNQAQSTIQNNQNKKQKAKCLCCTPETAPTAITCIGLTNRSHNNSQNTKRMKHYQLKKKTLELLKIEKNKDYYSKTLDGVT